jgi:predicted DNA-binding transcriptional regulator YafY
MDKFDRIFHLHTILSGRRTPIPLEDLTARLECSDSTVHRIIAMMRTQLGAPIKWRADAGGYQYEESGAEYQLPGLWFTPAELQALAVVQRLLKDLSGGLLDEHVGPLARRLEQLSQHKRLNLGEAARRLRFPAIATRQVGAAFAIAASATLQRRKLWMEYHSRNTDEHTERTISPQRLTHYREVWYLDAWDELRNELRSFSVDRISHPTLLNTSAVDIPDAELDEHYATAYGIFGGKPDKIAVLRFSRERARWVADEKWHPEQQGTILADGRYELRIPYRDSRELVMDILRHGAHVQVAEPSELRGEVVAELEAALSLCRAGSAN